jgi:predicted kinase
MEAVLLIGIPAAGKSTFCRQRFFDTHVRISLDMLGTREREAILLRACLEAGQPFVVDNTNVLAVNRAVYIRAAHAAGFRVTGFFFDVDRRTSIARNKHRSDKKPVPVHGILRAIKQIERPRAEESFDALFRVSPGSGDSFEVSPYEPQNG